MFSNADFGNAICIATMNIFKYTGKMGRFREMHRKNNGIQVHTF